MRILHIISGLNIGGAEIMLRKLLSVWDLANDQVEVVSLTDTGMVGEQIGQLGISVMPLGMRRGRPSIFGIVRLARHLRRRKPELVQTWLYHADLIGGLACGLAGKVPVVWGIRNGVLEPVGNKRTTIWTAKFCARLSRRIPKKIVCCSTQAQRFHESMGYHAKRIVVIPNGFDLAAFRPDQSARASVRLELGIPADGFLIGLAARFDPQKDHQNFLGAARTLAMRKAEAHFILCGEGVDGNNLQLTKWADRPELKGRVHLVGRRTDMPRITASFDVACCSSYTEGFPNILGEAMACGVPCVTTDVGDAAMIVGTTGVVVPKRDPEALADAWEKLIEMSPTRRAELGASARQRIKDNFELGKVAARYQRLYQSVLALSGTDMVLDTSDNWHRKETRDR